jgi:hypothetical protein
MEVWSRVLGTESTKLNTFIATGGDVRLVTSGCSDCLNSVDLFGRALSIDNAYRHLTTAEQYLLDANKMQDSAPHTDAGSSALNAVVRAKEWLRPYAVSPDTAACRDPPVCKVVPPVGVAAKSASIDQVGVLGMILKSSERRDKKREWSQFLFLA